MKEVETLPYKHSFVNKIISQRSNSFSTTPKPSKNKSLPLIFYHPPIVKYGQAFFKSNILNMKKTILLNNR